jgi:hypothetical protein
MSRTKLKRSSRREFLGGLGLLSGAAGGAAAVTANHKAG